MARGKTWTSDELIIAMNLYCKIPFGQLHHRNPVIVEMAEKLGRTAGSLAMKLCNFASLDPVQQARGIKGLAGASNRDREIWTEFHDNWTKLAGQSETLVEDFMSGRSEDQRARKRRHGPQAPPHARTTVPETTEAVATVRARRGQDFFRQAVLASYGSRCCVTDNPVPELLVASHIAPWSEFPKERLNPRNGLCLATMHDAAFDRGLITFDEENKLVLSRYLRDFFSEKSIRINFAAYDGRKIRMPDRFAPEERFLEHHRERVFVG